MRLKEIIKSLEELAPPSLQESYDNSGLIVGDPEKEIRSAIICLDSTEEVVEEAIAQKADLIIAHHPIVFGGLKRFTGKDYVQRTVMKAIKSDIAIYAIHTNLDNVLAGVNMKIAERLGLEHREILSPKKGILYTLALYAPQNSIQGVLNALFEAGAGNIGNYSECSFRNEGKGTFKGNEESNPAVGDKGNRHQEAESKIEVLVEDFKLPAVLRAMNESHPYEEVAHHIIPLDNRHQNIGSGMVGELASPMKADEFLQHLKTSMNTECVRYTKSVKDEVKKVAICGGSGSFLLGDAIRLGADVFITGDFKYHQFFDADGKIQIADIGHYESEQFTIDLLYEYLSRKFPKFDLHFTKVNTNPINYC